MVTPLGERHCEEQSDEAIQKEEFGFARRHEGHEGADVLLRAFVPWSEKSWIASLRSQ
jgi:hypothetical protein